MKKLLFLIIAVAVIVFAVKKFAPTTAKAVPLSGEWIYTTEDGIMGKKETVTKKVDTDGRKFRLVESGDSDGYSFETTSVYNGETLFTKTKSSYAGSTYPTPPTENQSKIEAKDAQKMMFWMAEVLGGSQAGPGGAVAGRQTELYQAKETQPDRIVTIQHWLDAEHKTLLKSSFSIYAKQVESLLTKNSYECQKIQYGNPNPSLFEKP